MEILSHINLRPVIPGEDYVIGDGHGYKDGSGFTMSSNFDSWWHGTGTNSYDDSCYQGDGAGDRHGNGLMNTVW